MIFFYFIFIISTLNNTIQYSIPSQLGSPPVLDRAITIYNQIFLYPSIPFWGIASILAICLFRPDDDDDPKVIAIIFQIFSAIILLLASFLGYAGNSKLTSIFNSDNFKSSHDIYKFNTNINIKKIYQKNVKSAMILYENISDINHNSFVDTIMLNNFKMKYETIFSNVNGKYRLSFGHLYSYKNIYLNEKLARMDISRQNTLNQIQLYSDKYYYFSKSIQKTLQRFKENNIDEITLEKNNSLSKDEIEKWFSTNLSYILSTGILVLAVSYSIVFFCQNKFSRCCFCLYPLFALATIGMTLFSCYFMTSKTYKKLIKDCKPRKSSSINCISDDFEELLSDIKKHLTDFEGLKKSFHINDKIELQELNHKINSNEIHENNDLLYLQYATNSIYRDDLIKMIQIIDQNENILIKMKELINEISNNSYLICPMITNMHKEIEILFDNMIDEKLNSIKILKSSESCDKIINGVNCCTIGCFFLIFGLLFMGVSVCLRRVHMEDPPLRVSNYEENDFETTFIGKKIAYFAIYVQSSETLSIIRTELSTPNGIFTYLRGNYRKSQSIHSCLYREDLFGEGFYFSSTKKDAVFEIENNLGRHLNIGQIAFIVCQVDFGKSLIVPYNKRNYFKYPNSLSTYSCNSVSGSTDKICEFIVYDMDQIVPIQIELAQSTDLE